MANIFKKLAGLSDDKKNDDNNDDNVNVNYFPKKIINNAQEDERREEWLSNDYEEGQLSIDVFQTPDKLVVKSTIAGVKPSDIDISINNDMLTIRGRREVNTEVEEKDFLLRECYCGSFSRSIILPVEVKADKIEASLENGILTITLPKVKTAKQIFITVKEK
ncbi:MAG: Hsp20/alpha crystallin family protein [Patescibacteria group bacterium]|nr:Hsp20/alpha crystallin family protein [Patescibacteria group bacterium]MBU0879811.1 Hsp20/alpha crystallin family protein [Patescibacteria group bacterium]MBU0880345.1 Hsp20/alpha crystallin family protein [Patescibacteria group bacterium]MBU1062930.1 Hsp20/alpha crystallin family protein [Patescibacteria group bacterium]MBU1783427.1 Hsp20/alpha crystallin family protein [Patescibacteria group bacterium]